MSLVLYHFPTAVCAAKVRIVLAEKGLEWESQLVDLQKGDQWLPDYLALNPHGVVPTLVHDGAVLTESTIICDYLDEAFPTPPLRPADPLGRARMRAFTKREDRIHEAVNSLTTALVFRPLELAKPAADQAARLASMPPERRDRWSEQISDGAEGRTVTEAIARFTALMRDMDEQLRIGQWLAGHAFSLADCGLIAFVDRLDRLGLGACWNFSPAVAAWVERLCARPSFAVAIGSWLAKAPPMTVLDPAARDLIARRMLTRTNPGPTIASGVLSR